MNPIAAAVLTKLTMPGVAGKRCSWTHTSCRAGSKLKCMSATSMSYVHSVVSSASKTSAGFSPCLMAWL